VILLDLEVERGFMQASVPMLSSAASTISFLLNHPLNAKRKAGALLDFVRWQLASRLAPGPIAVPMAGEARILAQPGMNGATGNVYAGLHEFQDMAFTIHLLRPGDLFVDVGANVGSYSILAGAVSGADCIAIEPVPRTFRHLQDNLRLNALEGRSRALNIAIGAAPGRILMTTDEDSTCHVVTEREGAAPVAKLEVPVETLDGVLAGRTPTLLKIDVEGFETSVIEGATTTLAAPSLLALIIELRGHGERYGFDEELAHGKIRAAGFRPARYEPFERRLTALDERSPDLANVLYCRDFAAVEARLRSAPRVAVRGSSI
jgi:FkbM family methyltransferase